MEINRTCLQSKSKNKIVLFISNIFIMTSLFWKLYTIWKKEKLRNFVRAYILLYGTFLLNLIKRSVNQLVLHHYLQDMFMPIVKKIHYLFPADSYHSPKVTKINRYVLNSLHFELFWANRTVYSIKKKFTQLKTAIRVYLESYIVFRLVISLISKPRSLAT